MIILEYGIKFAGFGLVLICLANLLAPRKLRWTENLRNTDEFFRQVFKVHTFYIVFTMLGMALACLFLTDELILKETAMERGFLWFAGIFWGLRVVLHLFYYEPNIKKKNPYWNALFLGAFTYLAVVFLTTAIR